MAKIVTDNLSLVLSDDDETAKVLPDWQGNFNKINEADKDRQVDIAVLESEIDGHVPDLSQTSVVAKSLVTSGDKSEGMAFDKMALAIPSPTATAKHSAVSKHDIRIADGMWGQASRGADGQNVWNVKYIRLRDLETSEAIANVAWYLDDVALAGWDGSDMPPTPGTAPVDTQTVAPYALGGLNADKSYAGWDFRGVVPDQATHTLTAVVNFASGAIKGATVSINVFNTPLDGTALLQTSGGVIRPAAGRYMVTQPLITTQLAGKYFGSRGDCTPHAVPLYIVATSGAIDWDGNIVHYGGDVHYLNAGGQHRFAEVTARGENNYSISGDETYPTDFFNPSWQDVGYQPWRTQNGYLSDVDYVATSNVNTATFGLGTIDGQTLTANSTVLLAAQTAASEIGRWQVDGSGTWAQISGNPGLFAIAYARYGNSFGGTAWANRSSSGNQQWELFGYGTRGFNVNRSGAVQAYQTKVIANVSLSNFRITDIAEDGVFFVHTKTARVAHGIIERVADLGLGEKSGVLHSDGIQLGGDNEDTYLTGLDIRANVRIKADFADIRNLYFKDCYVHDGPTQVYGLELTSAVTAISGPPGESANILNVQYDNTWVWGFDFHDYVEDGVGNISTSGKETLHFSNPSASTTDSSLVPPSHKGSTRPVMVADLWKGSGSTTAANQQVQVVRPSSSAPGHVFVAAISVADPTCVVTPPTGWQLAGASPGNVAGKTYLFTHAFSSLASADGDLGPYPFTLSTATSWAVDERSIRNVDLANPLEAVAFSEAATPASLSLPAASAAGAGRVVVRLANVFGGDPANSWGVAPANYAVSVSANQNYNPRGRGAYDARSIYQGGDLVTNGGSRYLAIKPQEYGFRNIPTSNASFWALWTGSASNAVVTNAYLQLFQELTPTGSLGTVSVSVPSGFAAGVGVTYVAKPRYAISQPRRVKFPDLDAGTIPLSPSAYLPRGTVQSGLDFLAGKVSGAATTRYVDDATATSTWRSFREVYRSGNFPRIRPGAKTTGYADDVLTAISGDYNTQFDGEVIFNREITGNLFINHKNVWVIRSWVHGYVRKNYLTNTGLGVPIVYECKLGNESGVNTTGKGAVCFDGYIAIRCNVVGVGDGFKLGKSAALYQNWVHDMFIYGTGSDPNAAPFEHADGFQVQGDPGIVDDWDAYGNFFDTSNAFGPGSSGGLGANSAFLVKADLGPVRDGRIIANWLYCSAGVPMYIVAGNWSAAPKPSNITFRDNVIIPHPANVAPFGNIDDRSMMTNNRYETLDGTYVGPVDADPRKANGAWFDGTNSNSYVSTPYVASRVPQTPYAEFLISPGNLASGANQRLMSQLDTSANAKCAISAFIDSTGHMALTWYTNSSGANVTKTTAKTLAQLGATAGGIYRLGFQLDPASPYKAYFYFGALGEPFNLIETVTGSGSTAVNEANTPLVLSGRASGSTLNAADRFKGKIYYASLRSGGPAGTLLAEFAPGTQLVTDSRTPPTFAATTGEVWSLGALSHWIAPKTLGIADYQATSKPLPLGSPSNGLATTYATSTHQHAPWAFRAQPVTSDTTAAAGEWLRVDATAGPVSVSPPTNENGIEWGVEKTDASNNAVTLAATVSGTLNRQLLSRWDSLSVAGDGTNWTRTGQPGQKGDIGNTGASGSSRRDLIRSSGSITENIPRAEFSLGSTGVLTSGRLFLTALGVKNGDIITGLAFRSGSQAAVAPTSIVFVLLDPSGNVLAHTNDDFATGWAAAATKPLPFTSSYSATADNFIYGGVLVTATTVPSLVGLAVNSSIAGETPPAHAQSAQTGIANFAALTSPVTLNTSVSNAAWCKLLGTPIS